MSLVLDASMALSWVILRIDRAEAVVSEKGQRLVESAGARVPAIWAAEVANTLLIFERYKRLSEREIATYLLDIGLLDIERDDPPSVQLFPRLLDLGRRHRLSSYDASYLDLALRTGLPLATFDHKLAEAAHAAGVPVFGDTP